MPFDELGFTIVMIEANYLQVLKRIQRAASSVGKDGQAIKLVVVTKGQPIEKVRKIIDAGAFNLGENYPEDAIPKIKAFDEIADLSWHMIGHVQSRKARMVCEYFDLVHSVDSLKLAIRLDRFAGELNKKLRVLLEFNVSGEVTKYGFHAWRNDAFQTWKEDLNTIIKLTNIEICGLMTIAPYAPNPEDVRPYFQRLKTLQTILKKEYPKTNWLELSMGMSADFEVAIQEGATIVRVGEAILGKRSMR